MQKQNAFSWEGLDDVKASRDNPDEKLLVLVYRLVRHIMRDLLAKDMGEEKAGAYFNKAGYLAGTLYAKNVLDLSEDLDTFIAALQKSLVALKAGNLHVEELDPATGNIAITVSEGQDGSECFVAGILDTYIGKDYEAHEVDCWASSARICRFTTNVKE